MAPDNAAAPPPAPDWKNLGRRLKDSRGSRSVPAVARATGISENTIYDWEKGIRRQESPQLRALIEFYEWPAGGLERVLAGALSPHDSEVPPFDLLSAEERYEIAQIMLKGDMRISREQRAKVIAALQSITRRNV